MAKNPHQLNEMTAEESQRWLTNFLADEAEWDRSKLWHLGTWAAGALGSLAIAFFALHWSAGLRQDKIAAADLTRQAQQVQSIAREALAENRRLTSDIATLNSDRDRLYARVSVLEHGLDSVTGSVARQSVPPSLVISSAQQPFSLPPNISPPKSFIPSEDAASAQQPVVAMTPSAQPPVQGKGGQLAAISMKEAQPASTVYAPPDPAAARLVDAKPTVPLSSAQSLPSAQSQLASAPVAASAQPSPEITASVSATPDIAVQHTEFGVDLGGGNSIDGLRALWQGLIRADATLLSTLRPIVVIRERHNGLGMQLRLVAGPLKDAAAAAKICAALAENDRNCETAVFDGQRLAISTPKDEKPADDKKAEDKKADDKKEESRAVPASRHLVQSRPVRPPPQHHQPEPPAAKPTPSSEPATESSSLLPSFLRGR